ncbi:sequence-specific single-stranded DNA-binding protein isoform X5 [Choristoneura fumiferana]|uniref:sequence-specific single-stranded DNA-binding protein isoform X5 n=1 Tax=Choristoneura fumiferana TaxID=7141 RepID=UPI003D15A618
MYAKGKGSTVPSDAQAREKLALYVYEYLLHVGAQKAAQTFLSEIRWEKNITLGEPPGFLHSWWCVFWDLYCAAPERRDTCEHSSEAKAFHDYGFVNSGYGVNGIGHNAGPAPPNDGMGGGGMPPGFFPNSSLRPSPPAPHPGSQPSPHGPQPQLMGSQPFIGPWYASGPRQAVRMGMGNDFNGPPGQGMMGNSMERGGGGAAGLLGGPRMTPRGPAWPMSPGAYAAGMRGPPPQGPGLGGVDGMKSSPGGVGGGGPGTPREDSGSGMGDYNLSFGGPGGDQNDQTESAAILKIKESMQEEAKRFEKDPDHPDYFMQ